MSEAREAKWYVVHTYSGYENKVVNLLNKKIENRGMQDIIQDISVPTEDVVKIEDGKKKVVKEKLYPGYVFIKLVSGFEDLKANEDPSAADKELWYEIRNTRGVTGFVSTDPNHPLPLTESDLASMGMAAPVLTEVNFGVGDVVRITSGPFIDTVCKVTDMNFEKQKLTVTISMFGRETPTELDFIQVAKE